MLSSSRFPQASGGFAVRSTAAAPIVLLGGTMKLSTLWRTVLVSMFSVLLLNGVLQAQSTATLRGTVSDQSGTVVPPVQNAFLTVPLRGQGAFAIVTAGQREDTTNFMINGVNLNDMANGQITFQPSINTVSEFKIDNSTPGAEYGRSSGSTVN